MLIVGVPGGLRDPQILLRSLPGRDVAFLIKHILSQVITVPELLPLSCKVQHGPIGPTFPESWRIMFTVFTHRLCSCVQLLIVFTGMAYEVRSLTCQLVWPTCEGVTESSFILHTLSFEYFFDDGIQTTQSSRDGCSYKELSLFLRTKTYIPERELVSGFLLIKFTLVTHNDKKNSTAASAALFMSRNPL